MLSKTKVCDQLDIVARKIKNCQKRLIFVSADYVGDLIDINVNMLKAIDKIKKQIVNSSLKSLDNVAKALLHKTCCLHRIAKGKDENPKPELIAIANKWLNGEATAAIVEEYDSVFHQDAELYYRALPWQEQDKCYQVTRDPFSLRLSDVNTKSEFILRIECTNSCNPRNPHKIVKHLFIGLTRTQFEYHAPRKFIDIRVSALRHSFFHSDRLIEHTMNLTCVHHVSFTSDYYASNRAYGKPVIDADGTGINPNSEEGGRFFNFVVNIAYDLTCMIRKYDDIKMPKFDQVYAMSSSHLIEPPYKTSYKVMIQCLMPNQVINKYAELITAHVLKYGKDEEKKFMSKIEFLAKSNQSCRDFSSSKLRERRFNKIIHTPNDLPEHLSMHPNYMPLGYHIPHCYREQVEKAEERKTEYDAAPISAEHSVILEATKKFTVGLGEIETKPDGRTFIKRERSGLCKICGRSHDRQGAMIHQCEDGNIIYKCHQNSVWRRLIGAQGTQLQKYLAEIKSKNSSAKDDDISSASFDDTTSTLIFGANMKCGKSKYIESIIEEHRDWRVVAYAHRISLAKKNAADFGLPIYDEEDANHPVFKGSVSTTLESSYKINEDRPIDLAIFDEFVGIRSQLQSQTCRENRIFISAHIEKALKSAKRVIIADANLTKEDIILIKKFRPDAAAVYWNHKPTFKTKAIFYESLNTIKQRAFERAKAGEKIYIHIASKKDAKAMEKMLKEKLGPKVRVIAITADSDRKTKEEMYKNVDKEWSKYDVIISTSTILAGLSFNKTHFDAVFAISDSAKQKSSHDWTQRLGRIRNVPEFHIYMTPDPKEQKEVTYEDAKAYVDENITRLMATHAIQPSDIWGKFCRDNLGYRIAILNEFDNMRDESFGLKRFMSNIWRHTQNIEICSDGIEENKKEEFKADIKKIKENRKKTADENAKLMAAAPVIGPIMKEALIEKQKAGDITADEKIKLQKRIILDRYNFTDIFVKLNEKSRAEWWDRASSYDRQLEWYKLSMRYSAGRAFNEEELKEHCKKRFIKRGVDYNDKILDYQRIVSLVLNELDIWDIKSAVDTKRFTSAEIVKRCWPIIENEIKHIFPKTKLESFRDDGSKLRNINKWVFSPIGFTMATVSKRDNMIKTLKYKKGAEFFRNLKCEQIETDYTDLINEM